MGLEARGQAGAIGEFAVLLGEVRDGLKAVSRQQKLQLYYQRIGTRIPVAPIVIAHTVTAAEATAGQAIIPAPIPPSGYRWEVRNVTVSPAPVSVVSGLEVYYLVGNPTAGLDPASIIDATNLLPTGSGAYGEGQVPIEPNNLFYSMVVGTIASGAVYVMRCQFDQMTVVHAFESELGGADSSRGRE